jgi:hypothetical protein
MAQVHQDRPKLLWVGAHDGGELSGIGGGAMRAALSCRSRRLELDVHALGGSVVADGAGGLQKLGIS